MRVKKYLYGFEGEIVRSLSKRLGAGMIVRAFMETYLFMCVRVRSVFDAPGEPVSLVRFHPTFGSEKLKEYFGHISSARFLNLAPYCALEHAAV
jgi:hypothetical protein